MAGAEDAPHERKPCKCRICESEHSLTKVQKFRGATETGHPPTCGCEECWAAAPTIDELREAESCKLTDIPEHARWCQHVYLSYCDHMDLMDAPAVYLEIQQVGDATREQIKTDMHPDD